MRRVLAVLIAFYTLSGTCGTVPLADAARLRDQGHVRHSIELLKAASQKTTSARERASISGELGISQLQARDLDAAAVSLSLAHAFFTGTERARYAIHLGNLNALRKLPREAAAYYKEALALAGADTGIAINAGLNLAALAPEPERRASLQTLSRQIAGTPQFAPHHLNLAYQAAQLKAPDLRLAYEHAEQARQLALQSGNRRQQLEAEDTLSGLYESQGRNAEALGLTQEALVHARAADPALVVADLLIALEWRHARLLQRLGDTSAALAAYQRAVAQLRASRDDIPIDYDNGRSSYRETIAPLHLGYAGLLLERVDSQDSLRRAIDAVEQIKQAELQDYLGDRCAVESVQGGTVGPPAPGVAVLYPIIFPDRVELLLHTAGGIERRTSKVGNAELAALSTQLAFSLRNGMNDFMPASRQLYDWLLKPFDAELAKDGIATLVVVPDGSLRLLPIAALHDGKQFAIEKYAISTVTGMTMTNSASPAKRGGDALVVGVSDPGPVVGRLNQRMAGAILQTSNTRGLAGGKSLRAMRLGGTGSPQGLEQLRASLQLPGVKQEVDALAKVLPGHHLLNAQFTVGQFRREAEDNGYSIIHIASHGVFGGSADTSFIMAYDDLLTMNGLQSILKSERYTRAPLELLSLSACETAEGNERAPLGMSGVAMKARAKSVLGTLWPLEDNAAQQVMTRFYSGMTAGKLGKAEALRQAQLGLIKNADSAHPFFWGSFILIGNWQ